MFWLYTQGELGPFAYKNQFAAYLEVGTGIAMARAVRDGEIFGWRGSLAAGAMFACAAAAGSRAGSILCLAELIVLPAVARLARLDFGEGAGADRGAGGGERGGRW